MGNKKYNIHHIDVVLPWKDVRKMGGSWGSLGERQAEEDRERIGLEENEV